MDYSLISAAATAINAAKQLGKAALSVRDFNQVATTIAEINTELLKAQESLFAHKAQLQTLQQENLSLANSLRELQEKLAERDRYTLVEISDRTFVLGSHHANIAGNDLPQRLEPAHYICQPCMAKGIKSVLQKYSFYGAISLDCPICKEKFSTGETEPFNV